MRDKFSSPLKVGDYVLATKYSDGDPGDQFCVGFLQSIYIDAVNQPRYLVADGSGKLFRANGFRRVKKISTERGEFIVTHLRYIELSGRSVWGWLRMPMKVRDK